MKTQVARWGNSLAVRIPANLARECDLTEGAAVDVSVSRGRLLVAAARPQYTLEQLVRGITPDNRHEETDWGAPVGKEVW